MEWSGRAPASPAREAGKGIKDKEHAMTYKLNSGIAVIGIDIRKNSFRVVGHGCTTTCWPGRRNGRKARTKEPREMRSYRPAEIPFSSR